MQQLFFKQFLSKIYNVLFSINQKDEELKINEKSRCLLLVPNAIEELIGCGGLLTKFAKNFDVYCLTNGFKDITSTNLTYEEKVALRKKEFCAVMEKAGVNYYHFFEDIDQNRLIMRFDRFKTISLSDYDYIFVPNFLDKNRDNKSVIIMLNELLKERPFKKTVQIVLFEAFSTLAMPNVFVDINDNMEQKLELMSLYQSQMVKQNYKNPAYALAQYRGFCSKLELAEAYTLLDLENLNKICKIYGK